MALPYSLESSESSGGEEMKLTTGITRTEEEVDIVDKYFRQTYSKFFTPPNENAFSFAPLNEPKHKKVSINQPEIVFDHDGVETETISLESTLTFESSFSSLTKNPDSIDIVNSIDTFIKSESDEWRGHSNENLKNAIEEDQFFKHGSKARNMFDVNDSDVSEINSRIAQTDFKKSMKFRKKHEILFPKEKDIWSSETFTELGSFEPRFQWHFYPEEQLLSFNNDKSHELLPFVYSETESELSSVETPGPKPFVYINSDSKLSNGNVKPRPFIYSETESELSFPKTVKSKHDIHPETNKTEIGTK